MAVGEREFKFMSDGNVDLKEPVVVDIDAVVEAEAELAKAREAALDRTYGPVAKENAAYLKWGPPAPEVHIRRPISQLLNKVKDLFYVPTSEEMHKD